MENWENLGKYLKKELPEDEEKELKKNTTLDLDQMEEIWEETGKIFQYKKPDEKKAWDRILSEIGDTKVKTNFFQSTLFKMAASIIVIVGLAAILFVNDFLEGQQYQSIVTVQNQQPKLIELSDGSQVWLNANSSLEFPEEFTKKERKVILKGEAFFKVARNEGLPFVIYANKSRTEVLGTTFNIKAYNKSNVLVSVNSGKVKIGFKNKKDNSLILTTGESGNINIDKKNITKSKVIPFNQVAWLTRELDFENTPLSVVVKSLSEYYNQKIIIEDAILKDIAFTGNFKDEELNTVLSAIDFSLNTVHESNGETIVIKSLE